MFKKILTTAIAAGALLSFAGNAPALDIEVYMGGASAQGKFWEKAGTALVSKFSCDSVAIDGLDKTNVVIFGDDCSAVPGYTGTNDVYIYYQQVSSSFGCQNAPTGVSQTWPDPAKCDFDPITDEDEFDCTGSKTAALEVGCADVPCYSITQTTTGYYHGRNADWKVDQESYVGSCARGNCSDGWGQFGTDQGYTFPEGSNMADPIGSIVVPFGFAANNKVTKTRCTAPVYEEANLNQLLYNGSSGYPDSGCEGPDCSNVVQPADETPILDRVAYNHWGWECVRGAQRCIKNEASSLGGFCEIDTGIECNNDTKYVNDEFGKVVLLEKSCPPNLTINQQSADCVSYFKCAGDPKVCQGGYKKGVSCTKPADCPSHAPGNLGVNTVPGEGTIEATECTEMPIDNVSRLMVLHIFSGAVDNWQDFGPWYPDLPIVRCMRHGGSGTHATLEMTVFRDDASLATDTTPNGDTSNFDWLFTESPAASDPYGHAGATWHYKSSTDLLTDCIDFFWGGIGYLDCDKIINDPTTQNVHDLKFQGVECRREKVAFGEYNYWSDQICFYSKNVVTDTKEQSLIANLLNITDPSLINNVDFGVSANYWATPGEMQLTKPLPTDYPVRVTEGDCEEDPCGPNIKD
jgi:hypothetical protein